MDIYVVYVSGPHVTFYFEEQDANKMNGGVFVTVGSTSFDALVNAVIQDRFTEVSIRPRHTSHVPTHRPRSW